MRSIFRNILFDFLFFKVFRERCKELLCYWLPELLPASGHVPVGRCVAESKGFIF